MMLEYLKTASRESPMSRQELADLFSLTDRGVRLKIAELRNEGHKICSDSNGKGYWMARSESDYKRFRAEYVSRARKIFETVGKMDANVEVW